MMVEALSKNLVVQAPLSTLSLVHSTLEVTPNNTFSFYDIISSMQPLLVVRTKASLSKKKRKKRTESKKELRNDQYPPDHVDYNKVEPVYKQINIVQSRILRKLKPALLKEMKRYDSLTTLLDPHFHPEYYISAEETYYMKTLHGSDWARERQRLYQLARKRKEEEDKQSAEKRRSLLSIFSNTEEGAPACDGCEIPPISMFRSLPTSTPILLRGFKGNMEMEEVFDTHYYRLPDENQAFSVTAICVTT